MIKEEVSLPDFAAWKNDPVTKFIFKYFEEIREAILKEMTSKSLISNQNGLLRLNELRGYVDAVEDMININPVEETYESESSRI